VKHFWQYSSDVRFHDTACHCKVCFDSEQHGLLTYINSEIDANSLRKEVIGNLQSSNCIENFVDFSTNGIHYKNVEEYKEKICRYLYSSVKRLIIS
jgi:hypothetical protein